MNVTPISRVMLQRHERRRLDTREYRAEVVQDSAELARAKAALIDDLAWQARMDLTADDVCWRCGHPLGARTLKAIMPARAVITHYGCEQS